MAPTFGFAFLLLVCCSGFALPIFSFFAIKKKKIDKVELDKSLLIISGITLACSLLSQLSLIYSFIVSDYSVSNVYQNSHHLKPLIYKISGSWGNHEGSMLLLISIISGYTFFFHFFSKIDLERKIIITSSQSVIVALFASFTAFTSNPFERIFPVPISGLELNPILQDIGLALHPPMLYIGYIGFSLTFSFAIAGLLAEKIDKNLAKFLKNWLFFSYGFLTLGIGLGSWWAYRELGWGGFWFWDPVENISLMPWIAATALIHCIMILEKREFFKIWSAFLAILTFIMCLLGIFLVRSGILTSVHSFAIDASRGFFVIALIFLIGGAGLLILGLKSHKISNNNSAIFFTSKIGSILLNNYFLMIALFVVVLGTIYPIFSQSFFEQFISIGPNYYNSIFTILLVPFLVFLSLSNFLNYSQKTSLRNLLNLRVLLIFLATALLTSLTLFFEKDANLVQILILFLAILTALSTLFAKAISKQNFHMLIAHSGFALILIGVILTTSFGQVKEINLKEKETLKIGNHQIEFTEVDYLKGKNFIAREGIFKTQNNLILKPQLRYYPVANQTTNEASINSSLFGDLYLVMGNKDENENYAIRSYTRPFIYFIWVGCLLVFASTILKIVKIKW